jgi:putative glycerol-1-phosphate prenyltransferase
LDKLVLAYFIWNLLYVFLPLGSFGIYDKLIAFKNVSFFPFIYFIGRLIDPEKIIFNQSFDDLIEKLRLSCIHYVFVGGSSNNCIQSKEIVSYLKKRIHQPILLFPGSPNQFSKEADALLYLSLLSGRNPKYLIEEHVNSALTIKKSKIEVLPTEIIEKGKILLYNSRVEIKMKALIDLINDTNIENENYEKVKNCINSININT